MKTCEAQSQKHSSSFWRGKRWRFHICHTKLQCHSSLDFLLQFIRFIRTIQNLSMYFVFFSRNTVYISKSKTQMFNQCPLGFKSKSYLVRDTMISSGREKLTTTLSSPRLPKWPIRTLCLKQSFHGIIFHLGKSPKMLHSTYKYNALPW